MLFRITHTSVAGQRVSEFLPKWMVINRLVITVLLKTWRFF